MTDSHGRDIFDLVIYLHVVPIKKNHSWIGKLYQWHRSILWSKYTTEITDIYFLGEIEKSPPPSECPRDPPRNGGFDICTRNPVRLDDLQAQEKDHLSELIFGCLGLGPWWLFRVYTGDEKLPSYVRIMVNQRKHGCLGAFSGMNQLWVDYMWIIISHYKYSY